MSLFLNSTQERIARIPPRDLGPCFCHDMAVDLNGRTAGRQLVTVESD